MSAKLHTEDIKQRRLARQEGIRESVISPFLPVKR